MNNLWKLVRAYLRTFLRRFKLIQGFYYDYKRYIEYSGWKENMKDPETRNYYSVKVYHALEKSMSYKKRNKDSGWKTADKVIELINIAKETNSLGYHDKASVNVLKQFLNMPENRLSDKSKLMYNQLKNIDFYSSQQHGVQDYSNLSYQDGVLENPESFFLSRYSLREFSEKKISDEIIKKAIKLTMKTPSVCNRQAWHIYHTKKQNKKDAILQYQNGNSPFGKYIPHLFIITADLKGFFAAEEHYQPWIDGGLLAMSLIYALHSLGIASCPLNWSQNPDSDKKLRETINIKNNHTIIFILAAGYPDIENKVCVSQRRPVEEIFTSLDEQ